MYLTEEVCQIAINEILEEISYCKEDADVNDCSEFIDILQKLIKKYFGIIQILKQLGWNGFCIEELETIIKASQYNAKKLNELRKHNESIKDTNCRIGSLFIPVSDRTKGTE